jgi:EAL domain-containing protein (putative c-di-GMP-specific phosphodiesterase class I)
MIARTIMPLARHLGLDVVAEGVETVEQATLLKELQCKYAQGFLFSKAVRAEDVRKMLAKTMGAAKARAPLPEPVLVP